jgi:hypothetical protein
MAMRRSVVLFCFKLGRDVLRGLRSTVGVIKSGRQSQPSVVYPDCRGRYVLLQWGVDVAARYLEDAMCDNVQMDDEQRL